MQGEAKALFYSPPLPMPIVAYGGNVGEFMSWLTFS